MGFGLLFIGYFIASLMSLTSFGALLAFIGCGIICFASDKLRKYNTSFGLVQISSLIMMLFWLLLSVSTVSELLANALIIPKDIFGDTFDYVMGHIETALFFLYNSVILYAIRSIATDTEDNKVSLNAIRNFIFLCINLLAYVLYFVFAAWSSSNVSIVILNGTSLIIRFICIALNLILIFSCYMRICDENDVDMQRKPSKFAFINTMRERFDEKQKKAAEEHIDYVRKKNEKRKNKK